MNLFASLSIRTKLLLMLLAVGLGVDVVVGTIAFRNGARALEERSFAHLTSLRAAKAAEITRYAETILDDVRTVAEGALVATVLDELMPAYAAQVAPDGCAQDVEAYYREQVVPNVRLSGPTPDVAAWLPRTPEGTALQCLWLARNPHPLGDKDELVDPGDGSAYSAVHARIHPGFRAVVQRFGYYDLFVIDASGAVVYTVFKEPDFATVLADGSHLAAAFERARRAPDDEVVLQDFAEYAPSLGAPAAFAATPIRRGGQVVAVLAVQLPVDRIEAIMTGGRDWERDGLGRTGETYLVGGDGLMRSNSRFLLEDPAGFRARLAASGVPPEDIDGIERFGTTILQLRVDSEATRAAEEGLAGTAVIDDYRGVPVLSSWAPLYIPDLHWSVVSEMDLAEARAPVQVLFRRLTAAALALLLPIFLASIALSAQFVKPVLALVTASRGAQTGRWGLDVQVMAEDEFGELSETFNDMVASLAAKDQAIEEHGVEKGRLLGVIRALFGRHVSDDLASGLLSSSESIEATGEARDVTVLVGSLHGYSALAAHLPPKQALSTLNAWFGAMNAIVEAHQGVIVEYRGASLVAVFGAPDDLPRHPEKAMRCALEIQARLVESRIGLHSGRVVAGQLGSAARLKYAIAGEALDVAAGLEAANAGLGTNLLVSEALVEGLPEQLRVKAADRGPVAVGGRTVHAFSF